MAHDLVASFYGGYDQVGLAPARRYRIPRMAILIAIAVILLVVFIAADVAAFESLPVNVEVTSVSWVSEGTTLAVQGGFSLHGGERAMLSLSCDTICLRISGASVSAPFALVAFGVVYHPAQYTNVTVQAPSSPYSGVLTITLAVSPTAPTGAAE